MMNFAINFGEMKYLTILSSLTVDRAEVQPIHGHLIRHAEILFNTLYEDFKMVTGKSTYRNFFSIYKESLNADQVGRGLQGVFELLWPILMSYRYNLPIKHVLELTTPNDVYYLTEARNFGFRKAGRSYRAVYCGSVTCGFCKSIPLYEATHFGCFPENQRVFHDQFVNGYDFLDGVHIRDADIYDLRTLGNIFCMMKRQYLNAPVGIVGDFMTVAVLYEYLRREETRSEELKLDVADQIRRQKN